MPKQGIATKLRNVANKKEDANEQMKQRAVRKRREAGGGRKWLV
jgi:hypothetical protein